MSEPVGDPADKKPWTVTVDDCEWKATRNLHVGLVDCTCKHEIEDHGWSSCEVEYCDCEGGWEE